MKNKNIRRSEIKKLFLKISVPIEYDDSFIKNKETPVGFSDTNLKGKKKTLKNLQEI